MFEEASPLELQSMQPRKILNFFQNLEPSLVLPRTTSLLFLLPLVLAPIEESALIQSMLSIFSVRPLKIQHIQISAPILKDENIQDTW